MDRQLFELWASGLPVEEITKITQDWAQPLAEDVVRSRIDDERRRVASKVLKRVVKRAEEGDIAAVEWLERKQVLRFSNAESTESFEVVVV